MLLLPIVSFAQVKTRQLLNGRVIADSLKVDNLSVNNLTSHIGALTDSEGRFTIYARESDTLYFSSITFHAVKMVLKETDLKQMPLVIKLDVNVTLLDEVVITPNVLLGDLATDSKNKKTLTVTSGMDNAYESIKYNIDYRKYDGKVNGALPQTESQLTGVNFTRIYETFFKKKRKRKDAGQIYSAERLKTFPEEVSERFTHYFFTKTLKIPHQEIGLFLTYCDGGNKTAALLDPQKEFELTDYLVQKSAEYLQTKK